MSAEQREEAVFEAALQLPADQRSAYLDTECAGDAELRRRVEVLLGAFGRASGFMKQPAADTSGRTRLFSHLPSEKPGDCIGRYKLLQQIGEGGCGVVYMAEQTEPVRRKVALKVIKLGMDTKQVVARFEAERQALALMDHPNIAKVLDAGATDTGRSFFVMELVRGIRITEYCDQNRLSTQERLKLFNQVCQAIQHAHQKGVIHRDIKPSNILVADHDGAPVPKVIDFGIAKATTDQRLTDKTLFTAFEQFIGTPAYMSPEQARLSGLDIDTRTDIYSLGVLLYELLTGKTPFDAKDLLAAGLEEMRRAIREKEPQRPSTRLSTMRDADLTDLARQHGTVPPKLIHLVYGDLDWIVMKALEKDRTRRYETANGLALDVQRHLNNEPVEARPPSNAYRFQKLVHRHKLAVIGVGAVAIALVLGLTVSTWLFFKEREAHRQAVSAEQEQTRLRRQAEASQKKSETEAAKSQQVAQFLEDMLKGVGPSVALGRDTTMLREILDKTAARLDKDLKDQPEVEAELLMTIGEVYQELGEGEKAVEMLRAALAMRQKLFGDNDPATANYYDRLAWALYDQGNAGEAEPMARQALTLRKKMSGDEDPAVASSLGTLALVLYGEDRKSEAEILYRQALAMDRKVGNEKGAATILNNLSFLLKDRERLAEAESTIRESLAICQRLIGEENPKVATSLQNLGEILRAERKLGEAEITDRKALAMRIKLLGSNHPATESILDRLLWTLEDEGKLAEADILARQALANARLSVTNNPARLENRLAALANVQRHQGYYLEAESLYREALASARQNSTNEDPGFLESRLADLADVLRQQGHYAESELLYRERLASGRKFGGDSPGRLEICETDLADVMRHQQKYAEAEPLYREALANARQNSTNEDPGFLESRLADLADVLRQQGHYAESELLYRERLASGRKFGGDSPGRLEICETDLADVMRHQQKYAEAEPLYREALASARQYATNDPDRLEVRVADLASVLQPQNKLAEAEALDREALKIARKIATDDTGKSTGNTAALQRGLEDLSNLLIAEGKPDEANSLKAEASNIRKKPGIQDPTAHSQETNAIK